MKSWYHHFSFPAYYIFIVLFVCTELDDVLDRLQQGPSQSAKPLVETTDTSGDENIISPRKKKMLSKKTYKMKKAWASNERSQLFVTGATDPVAKLSRFFINSVGVFVLTHGSFDILCTIRVQNISPWTNGCI